MQHSRPQLYLGVPVLLVRRFAPILVTEGDTYPGCKVVVP